MNFLRRSFQNFLFSFYNDLVVVLQNASLKKSLQLNSFLIIIIKKELYAKCINHVPILQKQGVILMRSVQPDKIKKTKVKTKLHYNKHTIDRVKVVANKDMRKISNIVENLIIRYVESKV